MEKRAYTFGAIAKTESGNYEYCSQVGTYIVNTNDIKDAVLEIAKVLHRAPCDIFIDAVNDEYFKIPVGLYGELDI